MNQELFEIYKRNFPFIVREKETVMQILNNKDNIIIEQRDEQQKLIGVSVINKNTLLLLCVDSEHRNKGVGTKLLTMSENTVIKNGYNDIIVGVGFDYIMPGVPTSKRYFSAENENLYQGLDETASDFFTNRGYVHSRDCNCFDMRFPLNEFKKNEHSAGDTIDGITYKWAALSDRGAVCACTDDAYPEFTKFYQCEKLYDKNNDSRVLIAVSGGEVAGSLIVGVEEEAEQLGSIGCTAVRQAYRGKHIAVNLVTLGTKYLKDTGTREAYLSYTYTGLDHLYGYAGYKICIYYMMAVKKLIPSNLESKEK